MKKKPKVYRVSDVVLKQGNKVIARSIGPVYYTLDVPDKAKEFLLPNNWGSGTVRLSIAQVSGDLFPVVKKKRIKK